MYYVFVCDGLWLVGLRFKLCCDLLIFEFMKCFLLVLFLFVVLLVCEQLGIDDFVKIVVVKEVEGKVIGGVCCQVMWVLEDCYVLNFKVQKVVIYVGWCDMDEYMCENKIEGIVFVVLWFGVVWQQLVEEVEVCLVDKVFDKVVEKLVEKMVDKVKGC